VAAVRCTCQQVRRLLVRQVTLRCRLAQVLWVLAVNFRLPLVRVLAASVGSFR
jgi:hypothetical protein